MKFFIIIGIIVALLVVLYSVIKELIKSGYENDVSSTNYSPHEEDILLENPENDEN